MNGWICPKCGSVYSPAILMCHRCVPVAAAAQAEPWPRPWWPPITTDNAPWTYTRIVWSTGDQPRPVPVYSCRAA